MRTSELLSKSPSIVSLLNISSLESPLQENLQVALFETQLLFLASHERAHHMLSHVRATPKDAFSIWTETPDTSETAALDRQAQELHADSFAVWQVLSNDFNAPDSLLGLIRLERKSISDEELLG